MPSDPYQPYPSFPAGAPLRLVEQPAVQLIAAGPRKQRRLTVAFRLILVIPQFFVLYFLDLAGLVVAFLGWWAALFTGRMPDFAVSYLSGLARWNVRFYGYVFLLTDAYPPFNFDDDPAYPVVLAIPEPGRLNRLAVFFRFILVIWAYIVVSLVAAGASFVTLIAWLITLITGKLPAPLHLAFTAVLRYLTRYYCYIGLLTPTYPWKLFGDAPDASALATAAPEPVQTPFESAWGTPPAYGTQPGYGTPQTGYGTPQTGYGAPSGYRSVQPAAPSTDWRLVLPGSAKILLIVFITLGLISVGCQFWSVDRLISQSGRIIANSRWDSANNEFAAAMTSWQAATQACNQNVVACLAQADGQAALSASVFASQIQAISMPTVAAPDAAQVVADATKVAQDLTELSQATTLTQYNTEYASTSLQQDIATLYSDIYNTVNAL